MKIERIESRDHYVKTQIDRSNSKFHFCKVSAWDVKNYHAVIGDTDNPILCLGTRNGREIDLFRNEFFLPRLFSTAIRFLEINNYSFKSTFPLLEVFFRSNVNHISGQGSIGVEINPKAERQDVWIGSFDEMPSHWENLFGVVYSNSFDQSQDPYRTAREWLRVIRPGGFLIFCFTDSPPTKSDPVGNITIEDALKLFPGDLVYSSNCGSKNGYSEAIIKIKK